MDALNAIWAAVTTPVISYDLTVHTSLDLVSIALGSAAAIGLGRMIYKRWSES
ncbi:hypothetical protein SAMN05216404_106139 [Nitrosospira multiformis]|uniref:Uncharacterized protein n=1 Tax=Nitrosospira multiformis TaxID=1231 RepID=A0A1H8IR75_9PROT|nr:hypothetical protein [Nitrosospira multiformis]SEN70507.1 hypothetical protein SAMN05216404_106139 [Nitrosospira multiformis]